MIARTAPVPGSTLASPTCRAGLPFGRTSATARWAACMSWTLNVLMIFKPSP
jgi:hypothetical protein